MNDTILSPRQKSILNLINQSNGISREAVETNIKTLYDVSKPTVIRDLNTLIKSKLITSAGEARANRYYPNEQNPMLREFDLERYFLDDPDKRLGVKENFDFTIFSQLRNLYTREEKLLFKTESKSFSKVEQNYDPTSFKKELERFVIELSWKSSKIEGNTYTLLETEALIKDGTQAVGKKKEEVAMILNHKRAFETILQNKNDFLKINMTNIRELHNALIKDLEITTGIRKHAVGITGTKYRPLDNEYQLREALEKCLDIVNNLRDPLEKALVISFMVPYIQPFADGNKRTARMLTNAVLLAHNLYPLSYRSVSEDQFKKSLILFYEQGSVVSYKKLFVEQFIFANRTYFI